MDNIEIAPKEYWAFCTYDEAVLYCFSLDIDGKIGWRLPTFVERARLQIGGFRQIDDGISYGNSFRLPVKPIRDI